MKKNFVFLIFAILLSACSIGLDQFLNTQPTFTPAPTFTNTPTNVPTFTPTVPTPTFTVTPTLIGQKTRTSIPELTSTPLPVTPLPSITPVSLVPQVKMPSFVSISVSNPEFYKGKECPPSSVIFTAQAGSPNVVFVVLFVRFKSKLTGTTSEWTSITMQSSNIPGSFTHELVPLEMKALDYFENAWVQYQLVSTDANSNPIGRTDIFDERLTLLECVPTPTSTITITPTVLVP
jgi:hypothetical protein